MDVRRPSLPDVRQALNVRFPHLVPAVVKSYPAGTLALGRSGDQTVALGRRPLFEHSHVIGTTGGGKTNFLEHVIRQSIKNGDGVCVLDPHGAHRGSLYNSLICWLFSEGYHKKRRIAMSNRLLMEQVLHDLLPDLMALHAAAKSERFKLRIEKYMERILEALDMND